MGCHWNKLASNVILHIVAFTVEVPVCLANGSPVYFYS